MKKPLFLCFLSALLLSCGWVDGCNGLFLLIAFVPLLLAEYLLFNKYQSVRISLVFAAITFLVWNIITTWWIAYATFLGAIAAIFTNTLLMVLVFSLFGFTKKLLGNTIGYIAFIAYWIGFEHIFLNAEISWPWLVLGNGFAACSHWVQWYQYTGCLGGSLWALLSNVLVVNVILHYINYPQQNRIIITFSGLMVITIPLLISIYIYNNYSEKNAPVKVMILQPNIDPYTQKFGSLTNAQQLNKVLKLACFANADTSIDYFIAPETAIDDSIKEEKIDTNKSVKTIHEFLYKYPNAHFLIGAVTYKIIKPCSCKFFYNSCTHANTYNSALQISTGTHAQIYHKSKLVVGVEKTPFQKYFKNIKWLTFNFIGRATNYATQANRTVFTSKHGNISIAPVICYESVYGQYVTEYVKPKADMFFIITNDGWWRNSDGLKQHCNLAKLRAIETRRSISRCANTGRSAIINQRGDVLQITPINKQTYLIGNLNKNNTLTFYAKHGDYIAWFAYCLGAYFIFLTIKKRIYTVKR